MEPEARERALKSLESNPRCQSVYVSRARELKKLGFSSYESYLKSPLWKKIRKQVLARRNGECWLCPAPATQCHHQSYKAKVLTGEQAGRVYPICAKCHREVEFDHDSKRAFADVRHHFSQKAKIRRRQLKSGSKPTEKPQEPDWVELREIVEAEDWGALVSAVLGEK